MTRVQDFYNGLRVAMDYDNESIMAGLDNGIQRSQSMPLLTL